MESDGPIIGIMPWDEFITSRRSVPPGSRIFLYSDGCHEIHLQDGGEWKFSEFLAEVVKIRDMEGAALLQNLLETCRSLAGADILDDDFTAVFFDFPE